MSEVEQTPSSRKRASKACDSCHRRGRKCGRVTDQERCSTCIKHEVVCTWNRVSIKRGVKPKTGEPLAINDPNHELFRSVEVLLDNFFESIYPVMNTVQERIFREQWRSDHIARETSSYARVMAICALSANRMMSGATVSIRHTTTENLEPTHYLTEAITSIPTNSLEPLDFEMLQAISIVCVAAMETSDVVLLQRFLGLYHGALAQQGFHDEKRWPEGVSAIETEGRRRLYWHMYRLEVHTSLVFGHPVRCPELQSAVAYPSLPDDDSVESSHEMEWLSGWNFVTDIYRGIEHLISYYKARRVELNHTARRLSTTFLVDYDPRDKILMPLELAFQNLPERFKHALPMSQDTRQNRCGFQTANIIATYQLLRMLSYTADGKTLHDACQTAIKLIDEISAIPADYMRAMGSPMLQELSGLGHMLSSFITDKLSVSDYQELRIVMLGMSELLSSLASGFPAAAEASGRLRTYVEDIDKFLGMQQSFELPDKINASDADADADRWSMDGEQTIPWDLLQNLPWDSPEWDISEPIQLP